MVILAGTEAQSGEVICHGTQLLTTRVEIQNQSCWALSSDFFFFFYLFLPPSTLSSVSHM